MQIYNQAERLSTHSETESPVRAAGSASHRAVFMGTPGFVVPVLDALQDCPEVEVAAIYTPPDRRRGRGQAYEASPVKQRGQELGIPVVQPRTFRDTDVVAQLESYRPDVIVVAAYGRLLPPEVLAIPPFGCLNLHPSLLPRHRGPAPVAGAILAGENITGVSLMLLDEGMDTGPVIAQRERLIREFDDAGTLTEKLFVDGAALLVDTLPGWTAGSVSAVKQNDELATYTAKLERADGLADWTSSAETLSRRQRAYVPWPRLYTNWQGKEIKLLDVAPVPGAATEPGLVTNAGSEEIVIGTGEGLLVVRRLQMEGRRATGAQEFLRGYPDFKGARLG
ncbi:MAG: methionyl-tRNA formyltransferase [Chloroflexota bacterium]|nr:methionyl-tRNA formyltransferase [Chloroflexota bacterium]